MVSAPGVEVQRVGFHNSVAYADQQVSRYLFVLVDQATKNRSTLDASICVKIVWGASSCRVSGAAWLCARRDVRDHRGGEGAEKLAGDVPLEAAPDLPIGFPFSTAADHVGLGAGVAAHPDVSDDVNGVVQRPVSAPVEPVALGLSTGGLDRAGPGKLGEGGIGAAPPGVRERDDGLGGADWADSGLDGQPGDQVVDDCGRLVAVGLERSAGLPQG